MPTYLSSQRFQKIIQLALVVAMLASSIAFLPQPTQAKGSSGTLTARLNGKKVTVSGEDFRQNREFIVNAKSAKGSNAKLGTLKSDKAGSFQSTFTLPDKFKVVKNLTVCVKDNRTSKRTCTTTK